MTNHFDVICLVDSRHAVKFDQNSKEFVDWRHWHQTIQTYTQNDQEAFLVPVCPLQSK